MLHSFATKYARGMLEELAMKEGWRGEPGELQAHQDFHCLRDQG